jgi:hypothetical protein
MAFTQEAPRTPTAIADIEVRLFSPDPLGEATPAAEYSVQVRYSDGNIRALTGNLVPHLTQAQINALLNFMASLRTQAVDQILP